MGFTVRGRLDGLADVFTALEGLTRTVRNKILRAALTEATAPMMKAARQRVSRESGLLKKSIGRKVKTYRASGTVVVIIGPRTGFRQQVNLKKERIFRQKGGRTIRIRNPRPEQLRMLRNPVKYAHLVEKGTRMRAARPFLAPAFNSTKAQAEAIFRARVAAELEKFSQAKK